MTRRSFLLGSGGVAVAGILVGCGGGKQVVESDDSRAPDLMVLPVSVSGVDMSPRYFATNGKEIDEATAQVLSLRLLTEDGSGLLISVIDRAPTEGADGRWGFNVGCYRIMGRLDDGPVGACINRGKKHINFHMRNWCSNRDLFNYHVTGWWENGPQAGIYNSTTRWCAESRGTFTEIRNKIAAMLIAAGIGVSLAYAIATISTAITIPVFAL